ncbi:hypothetical protein TNCT_675461 [Trichonephila clavata]|uniref:Uncharacterized protein n=1 Tax=Trichonephila clavata TaxID=2740835 RepID=A0A8X6F5K8_TRICU|nr:hypothetical protein TNCT_675461 [Trichonephila clavata]
MQNIRRNNVATKLAKKKEYPRRNSAVKLRNNQKKNYPEKSKTSKGKRYEEFQKEQSREHKKRKKRRRKRKKFKKSDSTSKRKQTTKDEGRIKMAAIQDKPLKYIAGLL